ncbi:MAG: class I SAM-dependent methyltransferase [Gammaproteobacteria bacterium]|nr:class I SAM-dependent methyltransferase [Gammaproteobacteria bacterium]
MAHGYYALQHFNQWLLRDFLGARVIDAEKQRLTVMLDHHYGKHALLIGVPKERDLLHATHLPCNTLMSPFFSQEPHILSVESGLQELPIYSGSIDLVLLPHTLEFLDNPRQLLAEACRIVKPEGLLVIAGFNPISMWGIKKMLVNKFAAKGPRKHHNSMPWNGNFIKASDVIRWLKLSDFIIEQHQTVLFRPPTTHEPLFQKLKFLESFGRICFPRWGAIYLLVARAKVIPLTPIKMKWKQKFGSIGISTSIPSHVRLLRPVDLPERTDN